MTKDRKLQRLIWTPPGIFSYPYFKEPDTGRQYSDGQYKTDLFIPKSIFSEKGKSLQTLVLECGKEAFGKTYSLKNTDYRSPFKDTDTDDSIDNEALKNCIMIRAKAGKKNDPTNKPPIFIGPKKDKNGKVVYLSDASIQSIKGGDWGTLFIAVYAYKGNKTIDPGVSFALRAVQFWKEGEALGQGIGKLLETVEELEEEIDSMAAENIEDEVEETTEGEDDSLF